MLMKIKYFYTIYGEINENLQKRVPYGNYVYILNISGSDVCKIGHASCVFERIRQIRTIVKSVFPFIENSITYNVYMSSPLINAESKRALESELHGIFKDNNIDGEWFKCDFETAINTLREREFNYINFSRLKYTLNTFDDKIYKKINCFDSFNKLQYLKAFKKLEFIKFIESHYPKLLDSNKIFYLNLNSSITEEDLINILKNFLKYIDSNQSNSQYKKDVAKRIDTFISKYKTG